MELRVHLKVCEGCGCLWYRAQVETRVYCTACMERFKDFPTPQSRKRRGRPKKTTLPAIFAVQASAQSNWEGDFPLGAGCGSRRVAGRKGCGERSKPSLAASPGFLAVSSTTPDIEAAEGALSGLAALKTTGFVARTAVAGGAR